MGYRDDIISMAKYWAEPGTYRPSASDFAWICQQAGLNVQPSAADLAYTSKSMLGGNIRIGGESKSWCGIFAIAMWAYSGIGAKWTLAWTASKGNVLAAPGLGWHKVWGHNGVRPGDIAAIAAKQHHFVVTDVNASAVCSVDGNQAGNSIIQYDNWKHSLSSIVAYYTIND
jgi:hypothetical protein